MKPCIIVLVICLGARVAVAQPALTPARTPTAAPDIRLKDDGVAALWSFGATLGGLVVGALQAHRHGRDGDVLWGIAVGGLLIGPSAGHIYAGEYRHAVGMSLLRIAAVAASAVGIARVGTTSIEDGGSGGFDDGKTDAYRRNGAIMAVAGITTYVVATCYDFVDSGRSALRRNARARARVQVAPAVMRDASRDVVPALGFIGRW